MPWTICRKYLSGAAEYPKNHVGFPQIISHPLSVIVSICGVSVPVPVSGSFLMHMCISEVISLSNMSSVEVNPMMSIISINSKWVDRC
jgi:hypothetical protein